jgi:putative transposase
VDDSYNNALAETIIALYKAVVIHRREPWQHLDAVEYPNLEGVDWFSHFRVLEPIGSVPPAELKLAYHRQPGESAISA